MTEQEYKKRATPQINTVLRKMNLEFTKDEYDNLVHDAYNIVLSSQKITKTNVIDTPMHKEVIRSAAIEAYKRTHWVPTIAAVLNIIVGILMLAGYVYYTAPLCPMFSVNQIVQALTCWVIMLGTWRTHKPLADKIIRRKKQVDVLKRIPI